MNFGTVSVVCIGIGDDMDVVFYVAMSSVVGLCLNVGGLQKRPIRDVGLCVSRSHEIALCVRSALLLLQHTRWRHLQCRKHFDWYFGPPVRTNNTKKRAIHHGKKMMEEADCCLLPQNTSFMKKVSSFKQQQRLVLHALWKKSRHLANMRAPTRFSFFKVSTEFYIVFIRCR